MSVNETNSVPSPSPDQRRIAAERFERANQVVATGDFDYGIQLLLTCCKLDPGNLLFRQTLRRTQKAKFNNNMRGSRFSLITTARSRTRMKVARRSQEWLKVLEAGEEILTSNPWDLGVQMDMAEACEALNLLDIGIFLLDQARQKYPKDPTVNRFLARLFEKRGNFSHAIALWQLVKEAVPGDLEASHKAKDLAASETIQRGNYDKSDKSDKSSKSDRWSAEEPEAFGVDSETKVEPKKRREPKTTPPVDRASREAAPLLARLQTSPTDHQLYIQLAGIYRRHNQIDRARAAIEQGMGPTGNHYLLTLELLELDLEPFRQDLQETENRMREMGESTPNDGDPDAPTLDDLHKIRTKLLKEINSRELEIFRLKADRFPTEMTHRIDLGVRLLRADRVDESIVELQQARKDPRLGWKASMYLGYNFKRKNNWRLAQRNFEEALSQVPGNDEESRKDIMFQLASGLAESGDFAKALDLGHELANIDFAFRDIGRLIDEWQAKLEEAGT
jgi:tetratricopeptide (TPR) repeat protein